MLNRTKTLKSLIILAMAGTMLTAGLPLGAKADDNSHGQRAERGAAFMAGERFARADADGNRMLSLEEFQAGSTERFTRMDSDGDGLVTAAEMTAAAQRTRESRVAAMIERLDTNDDGALSLDEVNARSAQRFARLDRDEDGSLEPREMRRGTGERGEQQERGERGERQERGEHGERQERVRPHGGSTL
jgi:hypothetical protein